MLRVEILSIVNLPTNVANCTLQVTSKEVPVLSSTKLAVFGRECGVAKQFFVNLPARNDLLLSARALDDNDNSLLEGSFTLTKEYLTSLDSSVKSSSKSLPLKPSSMVVKIKMDFQVSFDEKTEDGVPLEERYELLLGEQPQSVSHEIPVGGTPKLTPAAALLQSVETSSLLSVVDETGEEEENWHEVRWTKGDAFVVSLNVAIGTAVLFNSKLMDVEPVKSAEGEEEEEGSDDEGDQEGPAVSATAYADIADVFGNDVLALSRNVELSRSSSKRQVGPVRGEREAFRCDCENPGIVRKVKVRVDGMVRKGDLVCEIDCSLGAQRQALLLLADQKAVKLKTDDSEGINGRFQLQAQSLAKSVATGTFNDAKSILTRCNELERVARDFYEIARTYGRVIISEMGLPLEAKTVRPLKMGGVLGGSKYVVRGVLFKIPNGELFEQYPDPFHIANKIQGHELKGLRAYFGWFFNRGALNQVSFPLMAVIDFKGHRITAMTQLPISGNATLIYGSDNAGGECDVRSENVKFSKNIRVASERLNLRPHFVINGKLKKGEIEISSCVDLEGHQGQDGRLYLLDFSRTFPPAFKDAQMRERHDTFWPYYHMLRAEAVLKSDKPLSADAFSSFQSQLTTSRLEESKCYNQDVRAVSEQVMTEGVMRVSKTLMDLYASGKPLSFSHSFHQNGVNMRYLGLVYSQLTSHSMYNEQHSHLYILICAEALMRVMKNHLRSRWRTVQASSHNESRLLRETVSVLNGFFAHTSKGAWRETNKFFLERTMRDFNFNEVNAERCVDHFLRGTTVTMVTSTGLKVKSSVKFAVLELLNSNVGLGLPSTLLEELKVNPPEIPCAGVRCFGNPEPFEDSDFNFQERVKNLDVVERALGVRLFLKALLLIEEKKQSSSGQELLLRASALLETALAANPNDLFLCGLMGDICHSLSTIMNGAVEGNVEEAKKTAAHFADRAEFYYHKCALADKESVNAQRKYAMLLAKKSGDHLAQAEKGLLLTLELCKKQGVEADDLVVLELVSILEKREKFEMAGKLLDKYGVGKEESPIADEKKGGGGGKELKLSNPVNKTHNVLFQFFRKKDSGGTSSTLTVVEEEYKEEAGALLEGYMLVQQKDAPKRHYCVLLKDTLKMYDEKGGRLKKTVVLSTAEVQLDEDCVRLKRDNGKFTVLTASADSNHTVHEWKKVMLFLGLVEEKKDEAGKKEKEKEKDKGMFSRWKKSDHDLGSEDLGTHSGSKGSLPSVKSKSTVARRGVQGRPDSNLSNNRILGFFRKNKDDEEEEQPVSAVPTHLLAPPPAEESSRNSFGPGVIGLVNLELDSANNSDSEAALPEKEKTPEKEKSNMQLPKMGTKQKTSPVLERGRSKNIPTIGRQKKGLEEARRSSNSSVSEEVRRTSGNSSLGNSLSSASAGDLEEMEKVAEDEGESELAPVASSGTLPLAGSSGPPRRPLPSAPSEGALKRGVRIGPKLMPDNPSTTGLSSELKQLRPPLKKDGTASSVPHSPRSPRAPRPPLKRSDGAEAGIDMSSSGSPRAVGSSPTVSPRNLPPPPRIKRTSAERAAAEPKK